MKLLKHATSQTYLFTIYHKQQQTITNNQNNNKQPSHSGTPTRNLSMLLRCLEKEKYIKNQNILDKQITKKMLIKLTNSNLHRICIIEMRNQTQFHTDFYERK